jgi:hypothetical protein
MRFGDGFGLGLNDGDAEGLVVAEGLAEVDGVGFIVRFGDGLELGLAEVVALADADGFGVEVAFEVRVGFGVALELGETFGLALIGPLASAGSAEKPNMVTAIATPQLANLRTIGLLSVGEENK